MGIRGLVAIMQRYGVESPLSGNTVVIDGPALVHRISEGCMSRRPRRCGFVCVPSYPLLIRLVIGWLNKLKSHDVTVRKIYFDGYLPPDKWSERKERLLRQSQTMRGLAYAYPDGSKTTRQDAFFNLKASLDLTSQGIQDYNRMPQPRPPFLIPAVLEALRNDKDWGPLVSVVPGEADMFCAQDMRENGGTILTADSDLLAHDLGSGGNVTFFWNIMTDRLPKNDTGLLMARRISPLATSRQLGIMGSEGLARVAFELQRENKRRKRKVSLLDEALQYAKKSCKGIEAYELYREFLEEFEFKEYVPSHHPVLGVLSGLDPRISEVVVQTLRFGKESTVEIDTLRGPNVLSIFLPILFENSKKLSAWTQSTNVRECAYSILQTLAHRRASRIIEYRTLESLEGKTGREVLVPCLDDEVTFCERLTRLLEELAERFSSIDMQWLAYAVYRDVEYSMSERREPSLAVLATEFANQSENLDPEIYHRYSWDLIHSAAQVQAHLYSMRIMKQVLDVVLAVNQGFPAPIQQLHDRLASLPAITEWPTIENMYDLLSKFHKMGGPGIIMDTFGIPRKLIVKATEEESDKNKNRNQVRSKNRNKGEGEGRNATFSSNKYSVLMD